MVAKKKKFSKITNPKCGIIEKHTYAFRCNDELHSFLKNIENKSEFIKDAIKEKISETRTITCPNCKGSGKIRVEIVNPKKIKLVK